MFHSRNNIGSPVEVTKAQASWREWRKRFIVVSGNGWENFEEDVLDGSVPYPICQWQGKPSKDSRKCLELGVVHLSRVGAAIAVGMQVPQAAWKKVEASSSEWDMMGTDIRRLSFLEVE